MNSATKMLFALLRFISHKELCKNEGPCVICLCHAVANRSWKLGKFFKVRKWVQNCIKLFSFSLLSL